MVGLHKVTPPLCTAPQPPMYMGLRTVSPPAQHPLFVHDVVFIQSSCK